MTARAAVRLLVVIPAFALILSAAPGGQPSPEAGLLFYLSGDHGLVADVAAGGRAEPDFAADVRVIADGARGPGLPCEHAQLLSYWAPGNIYAERGTLALHWRSREAVGPTEFRSSASATPTTPAGT